MVLRNIGVVSAGKICCVLYAAVGFILGSFFTLFSLVSELGGGNQYGFDVIFGVGAIVILPLFYGVMGLVCGIIGAALYNLIAGVIGGIELEFDE